MVRQGEEGGGKGRGNAEQMTSTRSLKLLRIVRLDFPTQRGHQG